jgi:hypothetical protein
MQIESWKTTVGGVLAAFGAALVLVPLPENWKWVPQFLTALGGALVGIAAKDYSTHSTMKQIQTATAEKK